MAAHVWTLIPAGGRLLPFGRTEHDMKKLIVLFAVAALGFSIVGCGSKDTSSDTAATAGSSGIKDKTPKTDDE